MRNHKNKDKKKPYRPTKTYKKSMTVIKAGRVPYATVTKASHIYNSKYVIVTEATCVCYQKFSKMKTTDKKVLNMEY